jgi:hypothetical protein
LKSCCAGRSGEDLKGERRKPAVAAGTGASNAALYYKTVKKQMQKALRQNGVPPKREQQRNKEQFKRFCIRY